jgi:glycine/serine hydroxymethyltransferase
MMPHEVVVDMTMYTDGGAMEKFLESQDIIVNRQLIPGDLQVRDTTPTPEG